jgi:hypothetical protein
MGDVREREAYFLSSQKNWVWGPRLTTQNSRYEYNSRSQETIVNPHNRVGVTDYIIHYITSIKVLHRPLGRIQMPRRASSTDTLIQ